jgi:lipopolysaccharide export system permease protein
MRPRLFQQVDKLVLQELYAPFLFGVGMFSLLTMVAVVLQESLKFITKYNLPVGELLPLLGLAAPQFIVLSIPMGTLLGTLLSAGRLNSDLEITGLRALGVSLSRVMLPYLAVGLALSILTLYLSERVVPLCNSLLKDRKNNLRAALGKGSTEDVNQPFYVDGQLRWLLTASRTEGTTLYNVMLIYRDAVNRDKDFFINADHASWDGSDWIFYDMRLVWLNVKSNKEERMITSAHELKLQSFNITPESLALRSKTADDLSYQQLAQVIRERRAKNEQRDQPSTLREFATKLAFKLSIPFTPLFFIFIAMPLAVRPQRSTSALGMGLALLIVVAYYVVMSVCQKAGTAGALPPVVAAWIPNALLLGSGLTLLRLKERG